MSDLVKRLREIAVIITSRNVMSHWDALMADVDAQYCNEAASEIERLTAELAAAKGAAWLIENGSSPAKYRAMEQGNPIWVDDPNAALRFARREDGEMFCAEDEDAWFVRQHIWVSK